MLLTGRRPLPQAGQPDWNALLRAGLKQLRRTHGWSAAELARILGISATTIFCWERGTRARAAGYGAPRGPGTVPMGNTSSPTQEPRMSRTSDAARTRALVQYVRPTAIPLLATRITGDGRPAIVLDARQSSGGLPCC